MSMSIDELKKRIGITERPGYNSYRVEVEWYGRTYWCISTNSLAWDRIQSDNTIPANKSVGTYTLRQAYIAFRDECLRKNGLK